MKSFRLWKHTLRFLNIPVRILVSLFIAFSAFPANILTASADANTMYTLTVNAANGTVALSPIGGSYAQGATVTLIPTANSGYTFVGWSGDLSSTTNPGSIVMNGDRAVTATFIPIVTCPTNTTVSPVATNDTFMDGAATGTNYGGDLSFSTSVGNSQSVRKGALLQWDLSSIPPTATVSSVNMILYVSTADSPTYILYKIVRPWSQSTATWVSPWATGGASNTTSDRENTNLWGASGTTFSSTGSKTVALNASGVTAVQNWIKDPTTNNGFTIQDYTSHTTTRTVVFSSSENPTITNRPKLSVTYCIPPSITGNAGVAGATITYTTSNGGVSGTTTADSTGVYAFAVNYGWRGSVAASYTPTSRYTFSGTKNYSSNVNTNQTAQNFTATPNASYSITGNTGVASGVVLTYIDNKGAHQTVTSAGSSAPYTYSITVPNYWSGTVTAAKDGYTFTPPSYPYSSVIANQTAKNYAPTGITLTISGTTTPNTLITYTSTNGGASSSTTSDGSTGVYSLSVGYGWAGTVTPFKAGYTFSPTTQTFPAIIINQTQNFTGTQTCYALTISTGEHGSTPVANPTHSTGCSEGQYVTGESISLSASPASGYQVTGWTGTSNDGSTDTNNSFIMPASTHTVGVTYSLIPPTCYALTITEGVNGSTPSASPSKSTDCSTNGTYIEGEVITLTATPNLGFQVAGWTNTANDSSTSTTNTVTMPATPRTVGITYAAIPCYALSISAGANGSTPVASPTNSATCSAGHYVAGEPITLTASPNPGYHISGWTGTSDDGSTSTSNALVMPASDHDVSVAYAQSCYTLTLTPGTNGGAPVASPAQSTICSAGQYVAGEIISLTASPDSGFHVAGWTGTDNDLSASTSNSLIMPTSDRTVSVTYELIPATCYALTINTGVNGATPIASPTKSSSCADEGTYVAGDSITLTAAPLSGYRVAGWAGMDNNTVTTLTNTVTMPTSVHIVGVTYEEIPPTCYTLSISTGLNGATPTALPTKSAKCSTEGTYVANEIITLTASPSYGFQVAGWSNTDNDLSKLTTNTVTMPASDRTSGVIYEAIPCYALTINEGVNGSKPVADPVRSTLCADAGFYVEGEIISLSATPNSGYQVAGWTGTADNGSTSMNNSVTMPGSAHTVGITYAQTCYALTITEGVHGSTPTANPSKSLTCSTEGTYVASEVITLTSAPATGYYVSSWNGTADDTSTSTTNSVTMPIGTKTVGVNYAATCYALSINTGVHGSTPAASPSSSATCTSGNYTIGEVISFTAAPNAGFQVVSWTGTDHDASTDTSNTLTMPAETKTVGVTYAATCYALTITPGANGSTPTAIPTQSASCAVAGQYVAGEGITLTALANTGYHVSGWLGTSDDLSTASTNSVTMPIGSKTVGVSYAINNYTVSGTTGTNTLITYTSSNDGASGSTIANGSTGAYSFSVTYDWAGSVTPSKEGYTFSPAVKNYFSIDADQTQDFAATIIPLTISGATDAGGYGATIAFTSSNGGASGSVIADASTGAYIIPVTYGWSGTVTPTKAGKTFTPATATFTSITIDQTQGFTTTVTTYTISGNAGIPGATMTYTSTNGGANGSVPSDPSTGAYSITVAYGWSGTVTPTKTGYRFSPAVSTYTNVTDNATQSYTATVTYIISGSVTAAGAGTVFSYTDNGAKSVTADETGFYSIVIPTGWSGTVTPSKAGYTFSPVPRVYTNITANKPSQDYTPTIITYTISGSVGSLGAGATLTYVDGTTKTVTAGVGGAYTITVPYNWSGTVTPTLASYTFTPYFRTYTNVLANTSSQNYTAVLSATTYYVNNTVSCSDSNPGTSPSAPFCTIGHGSDIAVAGNTVHVLAGTYAETLRPSSGLDGQPITFTADSGVTLTGLAGNSTNGGGFRMFSTKYVVINGFSIPNSPDYGIYANGCDHLTITNNHVTSAGTPNTIWRIGIDLVGTTNSTITGNTTDHNSLDGIRLSGGSNYNTVSNNLSYANAEEDSRTAVGINVLGSHHNTILHNTFYANEDSGININSESTYNMFIGNVSYGNGDHGIDNSGAPNNSYIGNTVQGNVTAGINIEAKEYTVNGVTTLVGSTGTTVVNNVVVNNGARHYVGGTFVTTAAPGNIRVDPDSLTGTTIDYNQYYLSDLDAYVQVEWSGQQYYTLDAFRTAIPGQEVHGQVGNPLLVSPAPVAYRPTGAPYNVTVTAGDYHISSGSPAVDSANSDVAGEPTTDYDGSPRVDDPTVVNSGAGIRPYDDRGAYEYQPTCYTLTIYAGVNGSTPTADPLKSEACSTNGKYIANQVITLTAAPAAEYKIGSWTGTDNNASTATTNTVLMPSSDHSAGVNYVLINNPPVITEGASTSVTMSEDSIPTPFSLTLHATDADSSDTSTFSFVSMGDAQDDSSETLNTRFANTVNQAATLNPSLVLFNGDLEQEGFLANEMNAGVTDIKTAGLFNNTFLIRGNHDDYVSGSSSLWESYFETAPNIKTLPAGVTNYVSMDSSSDNLNYSFNYDNSIFIGLDDPGDVTSLTGAELTFLDARLTYAESIGLTHAFIFFHGPMYCVESNHCNCSAKLDGSCTPSTLVTVINKHPIVSAFFAGHEHILSWTHMDSSRVPGLTNSFEEFITSPSGGYTYNSALYPDRVDYAYMDMTSSNTGFGSITVNGNSFTYNIYKVGTTAPVYSKTFTKGTTSGTQTLTWSLSSPAGHGSALVSGTGPSMAVNYTPTADYNGPDSFDVQVADGAGGIDTIAVNVTIDPVNDAPVITGQSTLSTLEDTALPITLADLTVTDVDNTYPTDFALSVLDGTNYKHVGNTITPALDYNGTLTVPVTVNDGNADSNTFNLTVTVTAVNDAPVIAEGTSVDVEMSQNGSPNAFNLTLNAIDIESDTLTWSVSGAGASNGSAVVSGTGPSKVVNYTPTTNYVGIDSFIVQVEDGNGGIDTITVNVNIISTTVTQTISLVPGWNLISFNVHPTSTVTADVLTSISGNYTLVYAWDANVTSNSWLIYDINMPPFLQSLTTMDETRGYWIFMTAADDLVVTGTTPTSTAVNIYDTNGWNLVGYDSKVTTNVLPDILSANGLGTDFSLVYGYNPTDPSNLWLIYDPNMPPFLETLTTLVPGSGYWIRSTADHTWTVPY